MEFNMNAILSNGSSTSPIPAGTYGVAAAIFPHAINEPLCFGGGAPYTPGGTGANLRYF